MEIADRQNIAKLDPFTAKDYRGLNSAIFQFDGIEVGGYGKTKEITTAWTDCIWNLATLHPEWFEFHDKHVLSLKSVSNALVSDTYSNSIKTAFESDHWTLEITAAVNSWAANGKIGGFFDNSPQDFSFTVCWIGVDKNNSRLKFGVSGDSIDTIDIEDLTKFRSMALVKNGQDAYCYTDGVKVGEKHNCICIVPNLLSGYAYQQTTFCRYAFSSKALSEEDIKMNWMIDKERFGI